MARGGIFACNDQDADVLANYGPAVGSIQYEIQQLEQQLAQAPTPPDLPAAEIPDQPEIHDLPEILDQLEIQPEESVCRQCSVLQEEIDRANDSLEFYKMKEATDLVEDGKYDDAATIYERLSRVRELEINRKWTAGDRAGAHDAERQVLKIKYELAMMLVKQGKLPEAEVAMDYVWQQRRTLLPRYHSDTNSAQRQLCLILRAQGSTEKYERARSLYYDVWSNRNLGRGDGWVMDNGHELGMVLIEQGSLLTAEDQLADVLRARQNALGEQSQATVETAAQLAALKAARGGAGESARLLRPFLDSGAVIFSPKALECAATVGEKLFDLEAYPDTERVCRMIWNQAAREPGATPPYAISAGWHLSLALYFQDQEAKYEEAKATLDALLQLQPGEARIWNIKSLLSWVCRKAKDFQQAAEFARSVWDQKRDADILGPRFSSTGVNRIWLLSRYEKNQSEAEGKSNRNEARLVWNEVLESTRSHTLSQDQKQSLAQRWRELAKDLDHFARQRKRGSSSLARAIEDAAARLERRPTQRR
jgi:tetratricopeptide (TPR) repeat protein